MAQDSLHSAQDSIAIGTLIGSRICHDIISPIGAISNGLELVALTGKADTPEMALIAQSVSGANARIRFYRVALGMASSEQALGATEIKAILNAFYEDTRLKPIWTATRDIARDEVQCVFLALLCIGSAHPLGAELIVEEENGAWMISAESEQPRAPAPLWARLTSGGDHTGLQPAEVQFALLPRCAIALDRQISYTLSDTQTSIRF